MVPLPQALALALCERVVIEQGTKNPNLIGIFLARRVERFPAEPASFSAFVSLAEGAGTGHIELVSIRLETDEQIYLQKGTISFPHRFAVINAHFRITKLQFPAAGSYMFMLLVDGELVAQRRIKVYQAEELS